MSKTRRRAHYAQKLREELRQRWMRELQEIEQPKTRQVDPIKAGLNFDKA